MWYAIRWTDRNHEGELQRQREMNDRLLAEKDKKIAEQNETIRELKAEKEKLMVMRFPSWGKSSDGGGTKP
ncbi:MAG: hypothetical protein K2V38_10605 [Gemmataceae bacterium]|nr:hypothetical protein [Gemmataceae bacterium]